LDYKDSGVDTDAHKAALDSIKGRIRSSFGERVVGDVGHFGGLFALPGDDRRVLVATTDGLGTKVRLLARLGLHGQVGNDLVSHCIDDIAVMGADPLFFLDYVAGASLTKEILEPLVGGFADACLHEGIALLGGETAEMPGVYEEGSYDVAGFLVGQVDRGRIVDGSGIRPGDALLGFPSSGLHTNGYSLATRALFDSGVWKIDETPPGADGTVGEMLARPHLCYRKQISALTARSCASGFAHITGGGLVENIPRILPSTCDAKIEKGSWEIPAVFPLIRQAGGVDEKEMYRVFNMGIGLVAVIPAGRLDEAIELVAGIGLPPLPIGEIVPGEGMVRLVER